MQIPADVGGTKITRMGLSSRLPAEGGATPIRLTTTLEGTAAWSFRWKLKWPFPASQAEYRSRAVISDWLDRWLDLELTGEFSTLDPTAAFEEPLAFTAETQWRPEVQRLGEHLLLPALPRVSRIPNLFTAEERSAPIWLPGGRLEVSMSWELPADAVPGPAPEAVEATGPGGLSFALTTTAQPPSSAEAGPTLTTQLVLELPHMLPASDYPEVKRFWETLQRAAERRLAVTTGS